MKIIVMNRDFSKEETFEAKVVYPYKPIAIDWVDVRNYVWNDRLCMYVKLSNKNGYTIEQDGDGLFIRKERGVNNES